MVGLALPGLEHDTQMFGGPQAKIVSRVPNDQETGSRSSRYRGTTLFAPSRWMVVRATSFFLLTCLG